MDVLYDIFPLVLYFLGAVLLVVIIFLIVKLEATVEKINILLDDIEQKSQSLNTLFDAIEEVGSGISNFNGKVSAAVSKLIGKVLNRKKKSKKNRKEEEMDEYE